MKLGMLLRQLRDGPLPAHSRRKMAEIQPQGLIVSTIQIPQRTNSLNNLWCQCQDPDKETLDLQTWHGGI